MKSQRGVESGMNNFNASSENYQSNAIAQRRAFDKTFSLLKQRVKSNSSILDLGCGPGTFTRQLADMTHAEVIGVDISAQMIEKASKTHQKANLFFKQQDIERLDTHHKKDVIFANSSLYYIKNRVSCYEKIAATLTAKGVFIAQLAYGPDFTTCFAKALNKLLLCHSEIRQAMRQYRADIFFYSDETQWTRELLLAGLKVVLMESEDQILLLDVDETMTQYESNVFLSVLNPLNYADPSLITADFCQRFRMLMRAEFEKMANGEGLLSVVYPRMYLVAEK
ncbi:methyltransferase domain-containing protein [uncultured Shewanella sp.]|uniref:class I SAM-dependent methyltransferase n=1 Tax=uncultured Shewanella sp. TaxID=173975 RepID=UPI002631A2C5|nr:methyltransferase domain-containing protein [uncultured Shewanella sp.]